MYLGVLRPAPTHVLGPAHINNVLQRDIFEQEEVWIAEGDNLTFSEWRERLQECADDGWNWALDDFYSLDF